MRMMTRVVAMKLLVCVAAGGGCKFPPLPELAGGDAGPCEPGTTTCADGAVTVCDAEGVATQTACTFGCGPSGDRCGDLAPSNGLAPYLDQAATAAPVVLTGDAVIDTDAARLTVDGNVVAVQTAVVSSAPVDILVIIAGSFEANHVTARGRRALAIVSDGDVLLHGTLSVSASHERPGAGAGVNGDPACTASAGAAAVSGTGGGGGGGHGTAGGRGGNGGPSQGGTGGAPAGNDSVVPLRGGCPGAYKFGVPNPNPIESQPGGGGGAVQVSTRGLLHLDRAARITASGGGAKGDTSDFPPQCFENVDAPRSCTVGSGGGAGGAVLLEAAQILLPSTAAIVANGGAGHCGFTGMAADGSSTESVAPGTDCAAINGAGSGGHGAAGTLSGFNGGNGWSTGGGGGGGSGRIRINLPTRVTFDPGPPVVSPLPSLGTVQTR